MCTACCSWRQWCRRLLSPSCTGRSSWHCMGSGQIDQTGASAGKAIPCRRATPRPCWRPKLFSNGCPTWWNSRAPLLRLANPPPNWAGNRCFHDYPRMVAPKQQPCAETAYIAAENHGKPKSLRRVTSGIGRRRYCRCQPDYYRSGRYWIPARARHGRSLIPLALRSKGTG